MSGDRGVDRDAGFDHEIRQARRYEWGLLVKAGVLLVILAALVVLRQAVVY